MKYVLNLGLGFLMFGLVGCQGSANSSVVKVANQYVKSQPTYQKPGAAISLVNSKVNIADVNVSYAIDLTINSGYSSGDLELSVFTSDGLELVDGETEVVQTLSKGEIVFPYTVSAAEEGRYYLYANAKVTDSLGKKSFRALTLIVEVGGDVGYTKKTSVQEKNKQATSETLTFGEPVAMPMQEEIITK